MLVRLRRRGPLTWIVHVGGLGWSGSGAVLDALLDTDRFQSLKGKTGSVSESRLFSGRPAFPDAIGTLRGLSTDDILGLWTAGARVPDPSALSPSVRRLLERPAGQHHINHKVLRTVDDAPLRNAAEATATLLRDAVGAEERATAYLRGTYAALRSLLGDAGRHILIDNDPGATPAVERHLRADDRVAFVTVIRDLRDQYVDRRAKVEMNESVPVNLLRTIRSGRLRRRELSALSALAARRRDRLFVVAFERFVLDADYRRQFLERLLGGAPAASDREPRFLPEQSARNIGLAVRPGDRIQRAVFRRSSDRAHGLALSRSSAEEWPVLAIGGGRRGALEG